MAVSEDGELPINADVERLSQVIRNLLNNAVVHSLSPTGEIQVCASRNNGNVEVVVRDTGPGIPPDDLANIFERFYRVDKSRSKATGGVGLGLMIVQHMVEAHRGSVPASSQEGQGAEFRVTLPVEGTS